MRKEKVYYNEETKSIINKKRKDFPVKQIPIAQKENGLLKKILFLLKPPK